MKHSKANITSWRISIPPTRPRSCVFNIKPIAVGTPLTESLGSYAARIAHAHHVSLYSLIKKAVEPISTPRIREMTRKGVMGFYETTRTLNGMEDKAADLAKALETLTNQSNLLALTMYPWRLMMPSIDLLKRHRTWCPDCLREWKLNGREIYEPLIWSVKPIKICDIHKRPLDNKCPHCLRRVRLTNFRLQPGRCSSCGRFLDKSNLKSRQLPEQDLVPLRWYWKGVASMLVASKQMIKDTKRLPLKISETGIRNAIVKCTQTFYGGSIDRLASSIRTDRTTVWMWHLGYALPELKIILDICGQHALDPVRLISEGSLSNTTSSVPSLPQIKNRSGRINSRCANIPDILRRAAILKSHTKSS